MKETGPIADIHKFIREEQLAKGISENYANHQQNKLMCVCLKSPYLNLRLST